MTDDDSVELEAVVGHCFYGAFAYDAAVKSRATTVGGDSARLAVSTALKRFSTPADELVFEVTLPELPPWPYFVGVRQAFSAEARQTIEAYAAPGDRIRFVSYPVALLDDAIDKVHVALPTEHVDVLSPWSTVAPSGVAQWWALDLHKLADRSFFVVPEARSNTVMRGDLLLALHELGWPGYATELRVMDGKHMVSYEEWAEHPEWTDYQPRP
ncbi:hypothetical protein [Demequina activiva]|uniref:Uncharacterized protein n=1 Tax=Demequina activiva TaxID=1582364 RepID=A0A919Q0Q3_9MICO|nr:hypothetical protein [Demequina activiva]GIG53992.1 hypothetical protein Dac01nite_07440 [Demequina activiva]